MKFTVIYALLKQIYKTILRPLLVKAIDDPDEDWDDVVLSIVDKLFDYSA